MQNQNTCQHEWRKTGGLWDGVKSDKVTKTGGPILECKKCFKKLYVAYDDPKLKEILENERLDFLKNLALAKKTD